MNIEQFFSDLNLQSVLENQTEQHKQTIKNILDGHSKISFRRIKKQAIPQNLEIASAANLKNLAKSVKWFADDNGYILEVWNLMGVYAINWYYTPLETFDLLTTISTENLQDFLVVLGSFLNRYNVNEAMKLYKLENIDWQLKPLLSFLEFFPQ